MDEDEGCAAVDDSCYRTAHVYVPREVGHGALPVSDRKPPEKARHLLCRGVVGGQQNIEERRCLDSLLGGVPPGRRSTACRTTGAPDMVDAQKNSTGPQKPVWV